MELQQAWDALQDVSPYFERFVEPLVIECDVLIHSDEQPYCDDSQWPCHDGEWSPAYERFIEF